MALKFRALAIAGAFAGTTILAAPASAAALPVSAANLGAPSSAFDQSRYDPAATTGYWGYWGCRGWGCGYRRGGWRRNRVGAGDVILGAAIIGGIAAIASSNNRRDRQRDVVIVERDVRQRDWRDDRPNDYRPNDYRPNDYRGDDRRAAPRGAGATGLENAVSQCLARIERDVRVDSVDSVDRTGVGWVVSGSLFNGSPFQCRIGNSGQIDGIDYSGGLPGIGYSGGAPGSPRGDGQWSDQRYADARLSMGDYAQPQPQLQPPAPPEARGLATTERLPAYPGGPIPGETIPETIDGDL